MKLERRPNNNNNNNNKILSRPQRSMYHRPNKKVLSGPQRSMYHRPNNNKKFLSGPQMSMYHRPNNVEYVYCMYINAGVLAAWQLRDSDHVISIFHSNSPRRDVAFIGDRPRARGGVTRTSSLVQWNSHDSCHDGAPKCVKSVVDTRPYAIYLVVNRF